MNRLAKEKSRAESERGRLERLDNALFHIHKRRFHETKIKQLTAFLAVVDKAEKKIGGEK